MVDDAVMNDFAQSLLDKSLAFAVRTVNLARDIGEAKKEFVVSRQLARSGTSIGANIRESQYAQSDADFISKMSIALKEGSETQYWLEVLLKAELIAEAEYTSVRNDVDRLVGMLAKAVKAKKRNIALPRANPPSSPSPTTPYNQPVQPPRH